MRVLLIGESWFTYSVHQKGFDVFHTAEYVEGASKFISDLKSSGFEVVYVPAHKIENEIPNSSIDLINQFDCIIISDVGANSFLLGRQTFAQSIVVPNKLEAIKEYVQLGGSLLMVGGYMSFTGIDAKARYGSSPLKDCLPIIMKDVDDRVEVPEGVAPINLVKHKITSDIPIQWPFLLGYNQFFAKEDAETLVTIGANPLLVIGRFGKGKSAAFASDLAPHWGAPGFMNWEYYPQLWLNLINWLSEK